MEAMTTDAQLEVLCAQHVAGCVPCDNWKPLMADSMIRIDASCGHSNCCPRSLWPPRYLSDPAAVLALLEKEAGKIEIHRTEDAIQRPYWQVHIWTPKRSFISEEQSFAKAVCLAVLRAHGVQPIEL
jgi:hypothetical protein